VIFCGFVVDFFMGVPTGVGLGFSVGLPWIMVVLGGGWLFWVVGLVLLLVDL
jgi:hypothetical protein